MEGTDCCSFCQAEHNFTIKLVYDVEHLGYVCPNCGYVPTQGSDATIFETIGRATESGSHLAGRAEVTRSITTIRPGGKTHAYDAAAYTAKHLRNTRDELKAYLNQIDRESLAERAYYIYSVAYNASHDEDSPDRVISGRIMFGSNSSPWKAAACLIAAEEQNLSMDTARLTDSFKTKWSSISSAKTKALLVLKQELNPSSIRSRVEDSLNRTVTLDSAVARAIMDRLQHFVKQKQGSYEDAFIKLHPKNLEFLSKSLPHKVAVGHLAIKLAGLFRQNVKYVREAPFAVACVLFCCEATQYQVTPQLTNMLDVAVLITPKVSPSHRLGSATVLGERYRELVRWAAERFATLPWISAADKELALESLANEPTVASKKKRKSAKKVDLVRFYKEVIEYEHEQRQIDELPEGSENLDPQLLRVHQHSDIRDHRRVLGHSNSTSQRMATSYHIDTVSHDIEQSEDQIHLPKSKDARKPLDFHEPNYQHYLLHLLKGNSSEMLKASRSLLHAPVVPFTSAKHKVAQSKRLPEEFEQSENDLHLRQHLQSLLDKHGSNLEGIDSDTLFADGEMDSYLRSPSEYDEYVRLTEEAGHYEGHEELESASLKNAMLRERKAAAQAEEASAEEVLPAAALHRTKKRCRARSESHEHVEPKRIRGVTPESSVEGSVTPQPLDLSDSEIQDFQFDLDIHSENQHILDVLRQGWS